MLGAYGKLPAAKVQEFSAQAIRRDGVQYSLLPGTTIPMVTVHTDGVMLSSEDDGQVRLNSLPAFRLIPGKLYRVTVEEVG